MLLKVLAVALLVAVVGIAFVPAPFKMAPAGLVGVSVIAWIVRRDRKRSPSAPDYDHAEGS